MPFLTRAERDYSQRHMDPRDPNFCGYDPCECCKLTCEECREDIGEQCHGCGGWVLKGTLAQSPTADYTWLECPTCLAETHRLLREQPELFRE